MNLRGTYNIFLAEAHCVIEVITADRDIPLLFSM